MKLEGYTLKLCPDCREKPDIEFDRLYCDTYADNNPYIGNVSIRCAICHWQTSYLNTVKDCVDEWNSSLNNSMIKEDRVYGC